MELVEGKSLRAMSTDAGECLAIMDAIPQTDSWRTPASVLMARKDLPSTSSITI